MVAQNERRRAAIAACVADVYRAPEAGAEVVTQALLHMPAQVIETTSGWAHIRLPDYEGWLPTDQLGAPAPATQRVVVVRAPATPLFQTERGDETCGELFATTVLPMLSVVGETLDPERIRVALPDGKDAWVLNESLAPRLASQPFPLPGPKDMLALAREFARLAVPYLWGGITVQGVDCSGLAQLCCRHAGAMLPRDADQQYASMPWVVERSALQAGDLVFFARDGAIDHVGIALDGWHVLHASGAAGCVTLNSMNPADDDYSARLADYYAGARRPFPQAKGGANEQA